MLRYPLPSYGRYMTFSMFTDSFWMRRTITGAAILLLAATTFSFAAGFTFLGSVTSAARDGSAFMLQCTDGNQMRLEFLRQEVLRATLVRPTYSEPLLDAPLAKTQWDSVQVNFVEAADEYVFSSSALTVHVRKSPCRITIRDPQGFVLCSDDSAFGMGWDGAEVRCWKTIVPDDKFFGLGLKVGDINKRGREWTMWNSDVPGYDWKIDPLYQSIPFFVGLRGGQAFGIYLNNSYRTRFNMGAGNLRYYSFSAEQGPLDYFFIAGPRIPDVIERYTELTGRTSLPPLWSLGYQQCRWSYYPESTVRNLAHTFREKRIPCDAIYLDIHYMNGYRVFTWDSTRFPQPQKMLSDLSKDGFKIVTIVDPGVKTDTAYMMAREGSAENLFVKYPDDQPVIAEVWPGPSYFPDFSKLATRLWWGDHVGAWLSSGVRGIWNDMNEPACWGQAFPTESLFDDEGRGASYKKMHNLYGLLMCRAGYEGALRAKPNVRPFLLTRAGFAGEQRYTAVWTGDNVASFDHLALGVRMVQGLSLSGIPFCGTDVGGFIGAPTPELYARWIEFGSLCPLFRTHTEYNTPPQEPWSFGDRVEEISRNAIDFRYRLLPYFYSLFYESAQTGAPLIRPLFWSDQQDERTFWHENQHEFFLGNKLLAAPVVNEKQWIQKVFLPAGHWLDFNTDSVYTGGQTVMVDAPLERLPLFLREGAIVPQRDLVQYADEKPIAKLTVDIFPGEKESSFLLYEDDGASFDYQKGQYRLTDLRCRARVGEVMFTEKLVHDNFSVAARELELVVHGVAHTPYSVAANSKPVTDFVYDSARHVLRVKTKDKVSLQVAVRI
jgi:alpha-glucosidase